MASLHGETIGFVLDDVLAHNPARTLIVDDFRTLPNCLDGLLAWPEQTVFLIPTPKFRRAVLTQRYADFYRARANWVISTQPQHSKPDWPATRYGAPKSSDRRTRLEW